MAPRGWFCFFPCTSSEINWAVYIGVLLQKWRSASFVASRDLSFCRPAAVPLVNAYDSVPVQSYRSEGSWALCLVIPWERLNCPALWEPKHWFYRQNYKRERKKKTDDESPSSPYWEDSQLWWSHKKKTNHDSKPREKSWQTNTVKSSKKIKLGDTTVILKDWNKSNS